MKDHLLTILFSLFLSTLMASAQNVDLKNAAKLLSTKSKQTQLKAEKQLKAGGYNSLKHVVPLMYDDDEKVEKRARRIYAWVMFGLNDSIPQELCEKFYHFGKLKHDERLELIDQCSRLKPKQLFTLAALHSRVLESLPQNERERRLLKKRAISALKMNLSHKNFKAEEFDPRLLLSETRALVMSDIALAGRSAETQKIYESWFKIDSKIRNHLTVSGIVFELKRLEKVNNPRKELAFYSVLDSLVAKNMLKSRIGVQWKTKTPFKLTDLNQAEAIAYLEIMTTAGKENERLNDFKTLTKSLPDLAQNLPINLIELEVYRLLESKQFYPAFALAMKAQSESSKTLKCLHGIGVWASKNPDLLKNGLPHFPVKLASHMRFFIKGLASLEGNETAKVTEAKMKRFNDLLERSEAKLVEQWTLLLRDSLIKHYVWLAAIRGELDSAISYLESTRKLNSIYTIGHIISKNLVFTEQVVAKNHSLKTLEILVTTIWNGVPDGYSSFQRCGQIIAGWEKAHPDLLKKSTATGVILFYSASLWKQGKQEEAIEQLLSRRSNVYRASWLLFHLLEKTPTAEITNLLKKSEVPASFLNVLIKHSLEEKEVTADKAKQLIAVWSLNLSNGDHLRVSGSYLARIYAYKLWRLGHSDLCYNLMQNSFWDDSDVSERYMGLFPELALSLGKINDAIAYGKRLKEKQGLKLYGLKMAYLYRAAGDLKQAIENVKPFTKSNLMTELAIQNKDWDDVRQSLALRTDKNNAQYLTSLRAWYAYLEGNEKKALTEYSNLKKPNKWLILTVGNQPSDRVAACLRISQHLAAKKLKSMALDSYVIEMNEKTLRADLKMKQAVKYSKMSDYINYASSLPNQKKSAEFVYQLGLHPVCFLNIGVDAKNKDWSHKMLAIQALNAMGKTDLRDKLIEQSLNKNKDLFQVPWFSRAMLIRSVLPKTHWYPDALVKTLQLETPNQTGDKRVMFLEKIFLKKDKIANVKKLLDIARRHQQKLSRGEQADVVNFCLLYLGQKMRTRTKLIALKGDLFNEVKLELKPSKEKAIPKIEKGSLRLVDAKIKNDPMKDDFMVSNGIAYALELWNQGKKEAAQKLITSITIHVLLKSDRSKSLKYDRGKGTYSASYQSEVMALLSYRILELPAELIGTSADSLLRKTNADNYSLDEKYLWAAEIAEMQKNYAKALTCYQLYAEEIMFKSYADFTQAITHLHALEMVCAAEKGNVKKVIFHIEQRMKVGPYDTTFSAETLKFLKDKGEVETIKAIDALIRKFWQQKLTKLPNYEPYKQALKDWQEINK